MSRRLQSRDIGMRYNIELDFKQDKMKELNDSRNCLKEMFGLALLKKLNKYEKNRKANKKEYYWCECRFFNRFSKDRFSRTTKLNAVTMLKAALQGENVTFSPEEKRALVTGDLGRATENYRELLEDLINMPPRGSLLVNRYIIPG